MDSLWFFVFIISVTAYELGEEDDQEDQCLPKLADSCFKNISASLACHLEYSNKSACAFCSVSEDSLQCALDIIDTDCNVEDGRSNFDYWMQGLTAVQREACNQESDLLRVLSENPCFNSDTFLECVEDMTQMSHVVDLLRVPINTDYCNFLLIELASCNVRAHPAHSSCYSSQTVINKVIYTFFSNSQCGNICPAMSSSSGDTVILSDGHVLALLSAGLILQNILRV